MLVCLHVGDHPKDIQQEAFLKSACVISKEYLRISLSSLKGPSPCCESLKLKTYTSLSSSRIRSDQLSWTCIRTVRGPVKGMNQLFIAGV